MFAPAAAMLFMPILEAAQAHFDRGNTGPAAHGNADLGIPGRRDGCQLGRAVPVDRHAQGGNIRAQPGSSQTPEVFTSTDAPEAASPGQRR